MTNISVGNEKVGAAQAGSTSTFSNLHACRNRSRGLSLDGKFITALLSAAIEKPQSDVIACYSTDGSAPLISG